MADRLSIKWVDGNTNGTSAVVTSDTTFNVDQPTMWTPMSVISGLASGFCERRAKLDPLFVVGTTVTGGTTGYLTSDWNHNATTRDTIVSNCANNMAFGAPIESLYYAPVSTATFYPIGSAESSNYMTAMDGAIAAIIGATVTYTDINGATFTSASLSAAASAAAAADSSSYTAGITATAFAPALPAEWAKEKKWMLDQLRYMGAVTDMSGAETYTYYSSGSVTTIAGQTISLTGGTGTAVSSSFTQLVSGANNGVTDIVFSPVPIELDTVCAGHSVSVAGATTATFSLYFTIGFGDSVEETSIDYMAAKVHYVSTTENASVSSAYCIAHGGILNISSSSADPSIVIVEPSGTLNILHSSIRVSAVYLFDGATVHPYVADSKAYPYASTIYYGFGKPLNSTILTANSCTYISGGESTYPANVSRTLITGGAIVSGGTDFRSAGEVIVSHGSLSIGPVPWNSNFRTIDSLQIFSGGVSVAPGANLGNVEIWDGGSLSINCDTSEGFSAARIRVHSGGTVHMAGVSDTIEFGTLDVYDGATVQIDSGAYPNSNSLNTYGGNLHVYHHCTFGLFDSETTLETDMRDGWDTAVSGTWVNVTDGSDTYRLGKHLEDSDIKAYVSGSPNGFAAMANRISGLCYVGGTTYTSVESMYAAKAPSLLNLRYGARIAAKNRTAPDYYPSFYVRQHRVAGDPPAT